MRYKQVCRLIRIVNHVEQLLFSTTIIIGVLILRVPDASPATGAMRMLHILLRPILKAGLFQHRLARKNRRIRISHASRIKHGRQDIIQIDKAPVDLTTLKYFRIPDDQRYARGAVVWKEFLIGPIVSEHFSVVTCENDQRIVVLSHILKLLQNFSDIVIYK